MIRPCLKKEIIRSADSESGWCVSKSKITRELNHARHRNLFAVAKVGIKKTRSNLLERVSETLDRNSCR
jgi:hypothetical protein